LLALRALRLAFGSVTGVGAFRVLGILLVSLEGFADNGGCVKIGGDAHLYYYAAKGASPKTVRLRSG
jgi:hypothetical protein